MSRKFKTTTEISQRVENVQPTASPTPFGVSTPIDKPRIMGTLFSMRSEIDNQIHDNFKNLIMTNHGERLAKYDFGANLRFLLSERLSLADFESKCFSQIKSAADKYMPYINLDGISVSSGKPQNDGKSRVILLLEYSIPKLGVSKRKLEITMQNIG